MNNQRERFLMGVIGTGRIARRFVKMVQETGLVTISCVYNPNPESAKTFAEKNDIADYTDDWEDRKSVV